MPQYLGGTHEIEYGTTRIQYELIYSDRHDLAIHVHPDSSVVVEAPVDSEMDAIEKRLKKRARWIVKQQRTFRDYATPDPNRMYVSGETHYYLGRRYRLKVIQSDVERVQFNRGRIFLHTADTGVWRRKYDLMQRWYRARAKFTFKERLDACYARFEGYGIAFPELQIRAMQSQWGSCTPSGRIILNLKLIKLPKKLIDYVIIHELCHLQHLDHSQSFYDLLDRMLSDWRDLRRELNQWDFQ